MPEIDEDRGERPLRPRGRRAAPKSALARVVEPLAPALAAATTWVSTHRLGAMIAVCSIATVAMLGGGIALIQSSGAGAPEPDADSYSMLDDPRPTTTTPAAPSPFGPILPTPAPPTAVPVPEPDEAVGPPVDEPVDEPAPSAEPEPDPGDGPGRGNGPKKPKE